MAKLRMLIFVAFTLSLTFIPSKQQIGSGAEKISVTFTNTGTSTLWIAVSEDMIADNPGMIVSEPELKTGNKCGGVAKLKSTELPTNPNAPISKTLIFRKGHQAHVHRDWHWNAAFELSSSGKVNCNGVGGTSTYVPKCQNA